MFTITFDSKTNDFDPTIHFNNEFVKFDFTPENCNMIEQLKNNYCDLRPYDGEFDFKFDENCIEFNVGKFGDGLSGRCTFTVKNTPEIQQSFDNCIKLWKTKMQNQ